MMILWVLVFILGVLMGGCIVAINQYLVDLRTQKQRREINRLREKIHHDRVEYEGNKAYRRGFAEGFKSRGGTKGAKKIGQG